MDVYIVEISTRTNLYIDRYINLCCINVCVFSRLILMIHYLKAAITVYNPI